MAHRESSAINALSPNASRTTRAADAVRRRAAYAWCNVVDGRPRPAAEMALDWLLARRHAPGLGEVSGGSPRVSVTAAAIATAHAYGATAEVQPWIDWLLEHQQTGGAVADEPGGRASRYATSHAVHGLLTIESERPDVRSALKRACDYLADSVDRQDRPPAACPGSIDAWAPIPVALVCMAALDQAGRRLGVASWQEAAQRGLRFRLRTTDVTRWSVPSHLFAQGVWALLETGRKREAAAAMRLPVAIARRTGAVPALPDVRWISTCGLAKLARIWFALGERSSADAAVAYLRRCQRRSGGFFGSVGPGARYFADRELSWAAVGFLDAALAQVRAAFAVDCPEVVSTIPPHDGRTQAVLEWVRAARTRACIAEIGCGKGRYLRQIRRRFPDVRLTGIDPSATMLGRLPAGIESRVGDLLRIPAIGGAFDGVLAVEALEHSLVPRRAIDELCRVVRPGGSVLVIDKLRSRQNLSRYEPWERWCHSHEVSNWLSRHCENVQSRPIAHLDGGMQHGLFCAWTAVRRAGEAAQYRAA